MVSQPTLKLFSFEPDKVRQVLLPAVSGRATDYFKLMCVSAPYHLQNNHMFPAQLYLYNNDFLRQVRDAFIT